jgi:predicted Zn-dependent peptidase
MKKLLILLTLIASFGLNIFAQKTMNEDFRKTPPKPLDPRPFGIAKPFETTLPNGLKVVVIEDKQLPIVSYRLIFKTGDANDDSNGMMSAMTNQLNQGTKNRTSKQIAEEVEKLGASLFAATSSDNTTVAASALTMYNSNILKLMADIVLNPTFPANELKIYQANTIEGLKFQRSEASFLANEQMAKILYGKHPYSVVSPTEDDIKNITSAKLSAYHKKFFIPNNAILVVVGDVKQADLLKDLKANFGTWKKGNLTETKFPEPPTRTEKTLTIVNREGSAQSNILISNLAVPRNNPDYFPILVMNQVLGGGASARLFMNLREAKGYTYGAYSSFDMRRQAGSFDANSEVRTAVTGDSLKEFFIELNKIRDEKVPTQELQDAKNYLTGVFPLRAETQEGLTNLIVSQQVNNLPSDYLQTYREKIDAVTVEDVQRVAQKYVLSDKCAIVIVGDAEEIYKQAKPYATKINAFEADGKAIDVANFGKSANVPNANVAGKWDLVISVQGQEIPVTLTLTQDGTSVKGSLDSMLGKGEISGGSVSGNKVSAVAKSEIQGQSVELTIIGTVDGDKMSGTINAPMIPMPLPFTGTKAK